VSVREQGIPRVRSRLIVAIFKIESEELELELELDHAGNSLCVCFCFFLV